MTYIERDFKEAYIRMKERALDAERDRDGLVKALEAMLVDPPATLDEPDTDAEVIIKMRSIARDALSRVKGQSTP
jgi:hypothetical protein